MRLELGRETMSVNGSQLDSTIMSEHAGKSLRNLGIPSGNVQEFVDDLSSFLSNRVSKFMHLPVATKEQETRSQVSKPANGGDTRPNILVRAAGPGLIMGRIDLVDWATQTHERFDTPNGVNILKTSLLSLINGSMGQRGLLMRQIQTHNIGIRYVNMVIEFSVWLPSTDKQDTDSCYADCIKDSMNRLSLKEVQQYFPLFLFGSNGKDNEGIAMVSLPMAAPAAVPNDTETADITSPKDACEMLFCTTKQKKRKGVPYCGTCRKFMEETVKWYCDTHRIHPAKEKDKFVPAVRNERYGCKHPKIGTCDCKSCHSLRRFDELYPNCVAKLDEFKRRTFMFNDADAEHETEKLVLTKRGKQEQLELAKANKLAASKKIVIPGIAIPTWNPSQDILAAAGPCKSPNPFENLELSSSALSSPKILNNNGKVKEEDEFGAWTAVGRGTAQRFNNKRKLTLPQPPGTQNGYKTRRKASITGAVEIPKMQEDLISILPEYILPSPRRHNNASNTNNNSNNNNNTNNNNNNNSNNNNHTHGHTNDNTNGNNNTIHSTNNANFISDALTSPGLDLDADNLYKAMWDEDPISFTMMETMAQTSLMNTWSCVLCATWNHRGRQFCSTCGSFPFPFRRMFMD
eukprot:m.178843 g.178843  ORF g.178843 m.178843 type:complete len:631 (+) comp31953_c2_seq19:315-2207(+)